MTQIHDRETYSYFRSSARRFSTQGTGAALPSGTLDTLDARAKDFFRSAPGPQILLGALPFDRGQEDCLVQPLFQANAEWLAPPPPVRGPERPWRVAADPDATAYRAMVARALRAIEGAGGLDKVVLARRLLIETDTPLDPRVVAARLGRDPGITAFALPLPVRADGRPRTLVGGTPELLLDKKGLAISSKPLAGSARRQSGAAADRDAAEKLEKSDKNRREHAMVVEAILDTLAPYCAQLEAPEIAVLHSTETMWHLGSRIEGRLRDADISCAELVAQLHPTPAVCGFPRQEAQALIGAIEPFDRGFYAGAVGWLDAKGDGEWHIALRCGEICGNHITLYAGAGIVAASDPAAEADETSAKFLALLHALGIDEQGSALAKEEVA